MRKFGTKTVYGVAIFVVGVFFLAGCANSLQKKEGVVDMSEKPVVQGGAEKGAGHRGMMMHGDKENMIDLTNIAKSDLNDDEKEGILKMREEEKLARDVYAMLGAKWGQRVFLNITSSEQMHMDEVKQLIDRYALVDPVADGTVGVFASSEMQNLYTALIAKGSTSLTEALKVGAMIEDMDIKDLQDLIVATDNADIKYVYENLKNGSQRHLQSFVKNIEKNAETYTPQFISQSDYDAIISMEKNMGGKMGSDGCMNDDADSCGMGGSGKGCMEGGNGNNAGCGKMHGGGANENMSGGMHRMQ